MTKFFSLVFTIMAIIVNYHWAMAQSFGIRGGRSLFPSSYIEIRYAHYSNSEVNLAGGLNVEYINKHGLHYTSYGAELLTQYVFGRGEETNSSLFLTTSIGLTGQIESEPWVYKQLPLSKRINYGFVAEGSGEWKMTEVFGLCVFAQQRWLFNKQLGSMAFVFGVGLIYHFNP